MTGFENNKKKEVSIYDQFIGRPGHYGSGPNSATGILQEINLQEGYMAIQPSLVGFGNEVRFENDYPTIIGIQNGCPPTIRPLKDGDLENILKNHKNTQNK